MVENAVKMELSDHKVREQIRTVLDRNVMVEAAAGTGKTTELIGRIVEVIVRGIARVPGIAALTFTEKAAGELKLRLRSELERARANATGETLPRIDQALLELEEARVSTIHTFCADLLRERPVEAGVDPAFRVLSEPEADRLLRTSVDFWLQRRLAELPEGLRRLLRRIPRREAGDPIESLRRAVNDLADWRDFTAPWQRDPFDRGEEITSLVEAVHSFAELLRDCRDPKNDNFYKDTSAALRVSDELRRRDALGDRDDDYVETRLIDLLRRPFTDPRGGRTGRFGPRTMRADVRNAYEALLFKLRAFESRANADLAALLHDELRDAIDHYEEQKKRLGALDFVDLLVRVRDLLRRDEAVRRHFQDRIAHIFVDEFQDTDPIQVEILMLLAEEQPKPGKLFLVGDPKQSIYRFRRADLGMYAEVKERLKKSGALLLDLTTSFRSVPDIQSFVNAAFRPVMTGDTEAQQASYVPLQHYRLSLGGRLRPPLECGGLPPLSGDSMEKRQQAAALQSGGFAAAEQSAVVVLPVPRPYGYKGVTDEAIEESLPDVVAAYVEWLLKESGWNIEPRDICILFRRFETVGYDGKRQDVTRKYVQCLEARGIAQLLVGGKSFHGREEIETMRTALAAVEYPEDELSVFATLRGSLFGITDEELFEYRHRYQRLKPFSIPEDLSEHLQPIGNALRFIASLHGARNYRPVADTLRRLFTETRCHAGFVLRPSGKQVLANVMQLMEQARVYDESGALSFRGYVEQLLEEAEYSRASEAPVLEEGSEGVRLMTVHKAKGLEFPIVILADITANQTRETPSRYVDADQNLAAMEICGLTPVDVIRHQANELARERAEAVRLAYVATTRARDLLVIPAVADERREGKWTSVLNDAIYPGERSAVGGRRSEFGPDATIRPYEFSGRAENTVKPGDYRFDGYTVTWWDSRALRLDVPITLGIPQRELLGKEAPAGVIEEDTRNYETWRAGRDATVLSASEPSNRVETAIERSLRATEVPEVELVSIARDPQHIHGPRYGTLLHAVLATVNLNASADDIRRVTELQSRILGAPSTEVDAVAELVRKVIAHPLIVRAAKAEKLRREVPVTLSEGGEIVEGIADLAFEEPAGWTVIDFKTDAEIAGRLDMYKRQVNLYAQAISKATNRKTSAILMQL